MDDYEKYYYIIMQTGRRMWQQVKDTPLEQHVYDTYGTIGFVENILCALGFNIGLMSDSDIQTIHDYIMEE